MEGVALRSERLTRFLGPAVALAAVFSLAQTGLWLWMHDSGAGAAALINWLVVAGLAGAWRLAPKDPARATVVVGGTLLALAVVGVTLLPALCLVLAVVPLLAGAASTLGLQGAPLRRMLVASGVSVLFIAVRGTFAPAFDRGTLPLRLVECCSMVAAAYLALALLWQFSSSFRLTFERMRSANEELRRANEAGVAIQQRLAAFVSATTAALWTARPDGASAGLYLEQIHAEDRDAVINAWADAVRERRPFERPYRVRRPDHSVAWMLARAAPVFDARGEIREWVGATTDITATREAEEGHRGAAESFHTLIAGTPDLICVQRRGKLVLVNPAFCAALGSPPPALLGTALRDLVPSEFHALLEIRSLAAAQGKVNPPCELSFVRRDGRKLPVEVALIPVRLEGEPSIMLVARDVSERNVLQQRLLLADRMASVGTLAAGVAHEINNPLAYVMANLDFAREALGGDERAREALDDASEGVRRVAQIVRDLKLFSRPDAEREGAVDLREVLRTSIKMSMNEIRHRARLVEELDAVPHVWANEARLGQVFLNLLINAAQAIPEGHAGEDKITVRLRASGEDVVVEVQDTGAGMSAEVRQRIFDPFFTTKPVGIGTGLGLSICHGIVSAAGGTIVVETEPGRGSIFRVTLPASTGGALKAVPSEPAARVTVRGRVLVIDDEPAIGRAIARRLRTDHEVEVATSGADGLALARAQRFDAIICDLMMPGLTGMDVAEQLAASDGPAAQRMIFLTGGAFTPRAQQFLEQVGGRWLEKPVDFPRLQELIQRVARPVEAPRAAG